MRRVVFCTGRLHYDIAAREPVAHTAVVRIEELYPWPQDELVRVIGQYPALEEIVWAQEEPKNMGAWTFVAPRLQASTGMDKLPRYIGRPGRASPAEGYLRAHNEQQAAIVAEALEPMPTRPASSAQRKVHVST